MVVVVPRTVGKYRRLRDWDVVDVVDLEDGDGGSVSVLVECVDTVEVCTGLVTRRGRWRVRVVGGGEFKPRTKSFSGDFAEEKALSRVKEIVGGFGFRYRKGSGKLRARKKSVADRVT